MGMTCGYFMKGVLTLQGHMLDAWAEQTWRLRRGINETDEQYRSRIVKSIKTEIQIKNFAPDPCDGCDMGPMCETYGPPADGCDVVEVSTVEKYCKNCKHFKLYDGSCMLSTGAKDNNDTCKDFEECK